MHDAQQLLAAGVCGSTYGGACGRDYGNTLPAVIMAYLRQMAPVTIDGSTDPFADEIAAAITAALAGSSYSVQHLRLLLRTGDVRV
ncbi:MAG: hypothetical protein PUK59_05570 [Actinomycetaceae bacterium]|nr:hypothetical protein [Actinomycetaceae bacterium]MDY5854693.1 hypothetical protein [Arcanobacterium sp.]